MKGRRNGEERLLLWRGFAPNRRDDVILDRFALSPLDTVHRLPNMSEGDLLVGSFANDQAGYNRPFRGAARSARSCHSSTTVHSPTIAAARPSRSSSSAGIRPEAGKRRSRSTQRSFCACARCR